MCERIANLDCLAKYLQGAIADAANSTGCHGPSQDSQLLTVSKSLSTLAGREIGFVTKCIHLLIDETLHKHIDTFFDCSVQIGK